MTQQPRTPRTEAGRALLARLSELSASHLVITSGRFRGQWAVTAAEAGIPDIEAEARAALVAQIDERRLIEAVIAVCNRAGWSIYRTGDGSASWVDRREAGRLFAVEYAAIHSVAQETT